MRGQKNLDRPYRQKGALSHHGEVDGEEEGGGVTESEGQTGFGTQMAQCFRRSPQATEGGQGKDGTQRK